ncbi:MAG: hypothetical protein ABFS42_04240 [Candidatus Krumholzibacteriota bacterium]
MDRISWFWSSAPYQGAEYLAENPDFRIFNPEDRVESVRWFQPKERVLRWYLNPDLINQDRDKTQPSLDLYLRADDGVWDPEDWGGIMQGLGRLGEDFSNAQYLEIWVNDGIPDLELRRGKLHIDFGYINEDGFWPVDDNGDPVVGRWEREDGIVDGSADGVFYAPEEDIGLDGREHGPQLFQADFEIAGDSPYPGINGTARNGREDDEDLNGDSRLYTDNGYFTVTIDLKDSDALVDVVYDYDDVQELVNANIAWRQYRIPLIAVDSVSMGAEPNLESVTHVRIWYEDPQPGGRTGFTLQLSGIRFVDSL